ncbi:FAD-binding oxidoreductase [Marinicella litoralis]|uniref:FAD/FMN-containing dehydrogenase n=1 Tax=Marinicella litoralis TaxID=644220 RepID=A0A4V3DHS1_9GAMM|nr:FAD-binding oxidoreductase [Marinicella litoralis]TDR19341.1 FAD/FMN-containing dehydrogenase [Marinicella litoralis]
MQADELSSLLESELSGLAWSTQPNDLVQFGQDWTRFHQSNASVVFFPNDVEEVQKIIQVANQCDCVVIPSGGRTGYSAGAVATKGEWIISMVRFNQITEFNPIDQTVRVGAGVITEQLQHFATEQGLFYPVDFASSGSSHIAGNIATNAGGIRVLRYGLTRDYVLGLTVVTGAGEILKLNNGLVKNASGLDFRHLFIGSEGILGVVVEAEIKLIKTPPNQAVMLLALSSLEAVMSVFALARKSLLLSSFEFFSDRSLHRVMQHRGFENPFEALHPFYVLLEFDDDEEAAMQVFESGMEAGWVTDGIIAQSIDQAQQLWQYREGISESIAHFTPYKNDISVKISRVPEFMQQLEDVLAAEYPDFETIWFGHIGDGNLHLNILKPENMETTEFKQQCEKVNEHVYGLIATFEGSISAEHGVGLIKKPFLPYSKSAEEIKLMQAVKQVFDPKGVLNRGKVVDCE